VNALDVVENARSLPVWLIHGEDDRVSNIAQSEMLARALAQRGFAVRFDRAPGMGHAGALVARYTREVVDRASEVRRAEHPARVSYRSVRAEDTGAYGVSITRARAWDAFVDVEGSAAGVRVHAAQNVSAIRLAQGALGVTAGAPVSFDDGVAPVKVTW
jgi:acetyl esterase/lipase